MFLITAAKINQLKNEGLKGCNKSFTTFFPSLSMVCNFFLSLLVELLLFQLVHERPLCEIKSVRGSRIYFIGPLLPSILHTHI